MLDNRVLSTGYNGTPTGFANCLEGGCVRCNDSLLYKQERAAEMTDPGHLPGAALDRCICVHAEQNSFITAAKFGIALRDATLYTTMSPCFGCLKEAIQVGIHRIVYYSWYPAKYSDALAEQYVALFQHLAEGDPIRFEALGGGRPLIEEEGPPDVYASPMGMPLKPPEPGSLN